MLTSLSGASYLAENRVHYSLTRTFGSARCAKLFSCRRRHRSGFYVRPLVTSCHSPLVQPSGSTALLVLPEAESHSISMFGPERVPESTLRRGWGSHQGLSTGLGISVISGRMQCHRRSCEVEVDLLTETSLGAYAEAVADQQHADHQLGINGRASGGAVEASEMLAQLGAVDEAINTPQQVIRRDVILKAELIEHVAKKWIPVLRTKTCVTNNVEHAF
jgi:hypothetical protein